MNAHGRARSVADALQRWQGKTRSSRAEDDGGDNNMEAIEATGREKAGDRLGAPFDKNSAETALGQLQGDRRRRNAALLRRERNALDVGWKCRRAAGTREDNSARPIRCEHARIRR